MSISSLRKRVDVLTAREFGDEFVLLDTSSNRIHQFNRTASLIWRLCDCASPESIAAELVREYDVHEEQALSDVVRTLDAFRSLNLVS
jgi:coenzyme PQQ synthesis protein D (PqqD)